MNNLLALMRRAGAAMTKAGERIALYSAGALAVVLIASLTNHLATAPAIAHIADEVLRPTLKYCGGGFVAGGTITALGLMLSNLASPKGPH